NLLLLSESPLTTAPELVEMPVVTGMAPVVNSTAEEITLNVTTVGETEGSALIIEATAPMSPGRYNFDGSYRIIWADATAEDADVVWINYTTKFGTPPLGSKIGFRAYYISRDSGQQSPRFAASGLA